MRTYGRQKGITMIGFAMLLGVLGFFAYGFMKLYPAYAEYFGGRPNFAISAPIVRHASLRLYTLDGHLYYGAALSTHL